MPFEIQGRPTAESGAPLDSRELSSGLPSDLLDQAASRLGLAALVYAIVYTAAYLLGRSSGCSGVCPPSANPAAADAVAAGFVAFSLGMFFVARSRRIPSPLLLDLGLVYEVIAAAGIEIGILFEPNDLVLPPATGISWVCVWIVIFPLLVPSTPRKTAIAAFAAASAGPGLLLISRIGGTLPPLGSVLPFILPNYFCVGIALVSSRVVYRLGRDLSRARRLGSYQLVEPLGHGAMGDVWRAEHRLLARPAAIKLIRPEALGANDGSNREQLIQRFEREAQATARLSSPHTIDLHDFGVTDDGTLYYVMELLVGLDLQAMVERFGPLPFERTVFLLRQVCESLAEAHRSGLVHRDVKPANIYVCRMGLSYDFVKVLDFGLVKAIGATGTDEPTITAEHTAAGTPAFIAPEIALGNADIDGRADLYAVGCLTYWMLTGGYVFPRANAMQMVWAHVSQAPDPPSSRTELEIPPALEQIVMACLAKDPNQRPQTAEALLELLEQPFGGAAWGREQAGGWWRRHLPNLTL